MVVCRASLLASALFLACFLHVRASHAEPDPLLAGTPSADASVDDRAGRTRSGPGETRDEAIPTPMLALAAGAATAFVSLAAGTTFLARAETRVGKNRGLLLGQGGIALSPFLAHAVVGELGRGALFSIVPVLGEIGMSALAAKAPDLVTAGGASEQFAFIALLAVTVLSAGAGVVDVAYADDRAAARRRSVDARSIRIVPVFGHGVGGLAVGGSLW